MSGYVGIGVHRAARIGAAAHGGQVLVSETARALVADDLAAGVSLRDLGVHRLKDIDEPVRLYQVVASGLQERFPPPRTMRRRLESPRAPRPGCGALIVAAGTTAAVLLATGSASAKPVRLVANSIARARPEVGQARRDRPTRLRPDECCGGRGPDLGLELARATAVAIDPQRCKSCRRSASPAIPTPSTRSGGREWIGSSGRCRRNRQRRRRRTSGSGARASLPLDNNPNNGLVCNPSITGAGRHVWVSEGRASPSSTRRAEAYSAS